MRRGFGWVDRVLRREEMVNCFGVESLFVVWIDVMFCTGSLCVVILVLEVLFFVALF